MKCQKCGFENPPQMRYCGDCGALLKIASIEEEKKKVAILFADICDFTAMVATHDPEEFKIEIDNCLHLMAESVTIYDGVVGKFIGDAVMAVFGVPISAENDAEKAVRAGIAIRDRVSNYGKEREISIQLRIGIHVGDVIVAIPDGSPGREVNLFGDTVNIAARLEDTGDAGQIIVSEEINEKTKHIFDYESIRPIQAKGISEPLKRYRLIKEKLIHEKTRGFKKLYAPMIGRQSKLDRLVELFEEIKTQKQSKIVAVLGEAGIGKTRLVEEFLGKLSCSNENYSIGYGRCLGYAGAPTFLPFLQIVKQVAGIKDVMSVMEMRQCIGNLVDNLMRDVDWGEIDAKDIFLELLSLSSTDRYNLGQNTSQIFDQVLIVMEKLFQTLAAINPFIIFIEDIHWADNATLGLLKHLARVLTNSSCLLLFNSRPPKEYSSAIENLLDYFSAFKNFYKINIKDLTLEQSKKLIASLLTIEKLSEESKQFIVEKSGGNPFFVEELIRTLIELGIIEQSGESWIATRQLQLSDVPDSIERVLQSRIDHLPRTEKKVIQRAAVVGRTFWRRIVWELMEENVIDYLHDLELRDIINQSLDSILEDDVEYIFKHALLHESVYGSLLKRVRIGLHLKTAQWIENNYQDKINTCLDLLAFHFEKGGDKKKAAQYYLLAAKQAAHLYDNANAEQYFSKATKLSKEQQILLEGFVGWGEVCSLMGKNDEAFQKFESARKFCRSKLEEASILQKTAEVFQKMSNYKRAYEFLQWAGELVDDLEPDLIHVKLKCCIATLEHLWGNRKKAFQLSKEAEATLDALGRSDTEAEMERALVYYEISCNIEDVEGFEQRKRYLEQTLAIYRKLGNLYGVGQTLNVIGIHEHDKGNYSASLENYLQSYHICGSCGNRLGQAIVCNNIAGVYIDLGNYEKASYYVERYLSLNKIIDNRLGDAYAHAALAAIADEKNDMNLALKEFELSKEIYEEVNAKMNAVLIELDLASIYSLMGDFDKYQSIISKYEDNEDYIEDLIDIKMEATINHFRRNGILLYEEGVLRKIAQLEGENILKREPTVGSFKASMQLVELFNCLGDTNNSGLWLEKALGALKRILETITDKALQKLFKQKVLSLYSKYSNSLEPLFYI